MAEELTKEQKTAKLRNLELAAKEYGDEATRLRADLGLGTEGNGGGAAASPDEIERLAKEWDSLTQAERMRQYTEEPERWRKGKEAFEALGVRRLLNKR